MSSMKNGTVGYLDTPGSIPWDESKDLEYYESIHGEETDAEQRFQHMIENLEESHQDFAGLLDHSIRFFWIQRHTLAENALFLLGIYGKISLLRKLIILRSNDVSF